MTHTHSAALAFLANSEWKNDLVIVDFSESNELRAVGVSNAVTYLKFQSWDNLPSNADLIISCKLRRKIPSAVLNRSCYGGINIHPSLLPAHRGANPWFEVYFTHEAVSGVTIHRLTDEYDMGNVLAQESFNIDHGMPLPDAVKRADDVSVRLLECVLTQEVYKLPGRKQGASPPAEKVDFDSLKFMHIDDLWHVLRGFPELLQHLFGIPSEFIVGSYTLYDTGLRCAKAADGKIICPGGSIKLISI